MYHMKSVLKTFAGQCIVLFVLLILIEIFLKWFFPYQLATIGHKYSKNYLDYGWGFNPHEAIQLRNPDTNEIYIGYTNNHGWRDKNRYFENPDSKFRILVIGDSVTFGAITPDDKTYTRIMEDDLTAQGYNVEVINISYGGWGTDQEIEALVKEGIKYRPNIVIIQTTMNDLNDNLYYKSSNPITRKKKPFYYQLNGTVLERKDNKRFNNPDFQTANEKVKAIAYKSEIFKRFNGYITTMKAAKAQRRYYEVNFKNLERLSLFFDENNLNKGFISALKKDFENKAFQKSDIAHHITRFQLEEYQEPIFKILEHLWYYQFFWNKETYSGKAFDVDVNSEKWQLFFALLLKAKQLSEKHQFDLLLFHEQEAGGYQWARDWMWLSKDVHLEQFLKPAMVVKAFAKSNDIEFIELKEAVVRAKYDPHPNIKGNQAIANNILSYLKTHHSNKLNQFKQ